MLSITRDPHIWEPTNLSERQFYTETDSCWTTGSGQASLKRLHLIKDQSAREFKLLSTKAMSFTCSQGFKWSIGAIIGPSGSGKTTNLKHFGEGPFGDMWVQQHSFYNTSNMILSFKKCHAPIWLRTPGSSLKMYMTLIVPSGNQTWQLKIHYL